MILHVVLALTRSMWDTCEIWLVFHTSSNNLYKWWWPLIWIENNSKTYGMSLLIETKNHHVSRSISVWTKLTGLGNRHSIWQRWYLRWHFSSLFFLFVFPLCFSSVFSYVFSYVFLCFSSVFYVYQYERGNWNWNNKTRKKNQIFFNKITREAMYNVKYIQQNNNNKITTKKIVFKSLHYPFIRRKQGAGVLREPLVPYQTTLACFQ